MNVSYPTETDKAWTPQRVRSVRTSLKLSQGKFAQKIGVTRPTVSDWETGKAAVSALSAAALAALESPPSAKPPRSEADYWRGVYFAAETMSATVTELLRKAREAHDDDTESIAAADAPLTPSSPAGATPTARRASARQPRA